MLKKIAKSIGLISFFWAATTQALPIVQADAFSAGDDMAIYHNITGLTWLDLDVTAGQDYNQVISELDGKYSGWRIPTELEVQQLWSTLFSNLENWNPDYYGAGLASGRGASDVAAQIMNIFGTNYFFQSSGYYHSAYSKGLFKNDFGTLLTAYLNYDDYGSLSNPYVISNAEITVTLTDALPDFNYGILLVKQSVPEPSPLLLILAAFAAMLVRNRRQI